MYFCQRIYATNNFNQIIKDMKLLKISCIALICGAMLLGETGCSSMTNTGKGALIGGGGGAAAGAGIGALIGGGKGAAIGSAIGGRNHATVLHSCKAVSNQIETDKAFQRQMEELEKLVLA